VFSISTRTSLETRTTLMINSQSSKWTATVLKNSDSKRIQIQPKTTRLYQKIKSKLQAWSLVTTRNKASMLILSRKWFRRTKPPTTSLMKNKSCIINHWSRTTLLNKREKEELRLMPRDTHHRTLKDTLKHKTWARPSIVSPHHQQILTKMIMNKKSHLSSQWSSKATRKQLVVVMNAKQQPRNLQRELTSRKSMLLRRQ